jgi:predicted O-methyltransferase YrrM
MKRLFKYFILILTNLEFREKIKKSLNLSYYDTLMKRNNISFIEVEDLFNWSNLELKLKSPTTTPGQTSKLELLILVAFAKTLNDGENFLEIGTFDGNTALNCALNLNPNSKFITIDLPENALPSSEHLVYDADLIKMKNRSKKKSENLPNVVQIYSDSTKFDFSTVNFKVAFIDGGHDYNTVKIDTENVMKNINKNGIVLWHDYDVVNPVGDYLHNISNLYKIHRIKGTRIAICKL